MEEFKINDKNVYYHKTLDGGGTVFGINALKSEGVKKHIRPRNVLEMCSGPGFMGFYLNFNYGCENLILSDINFENKECIDKTISENSIKNTKFIESNVFDSFPDFSYKFDTIVSNPPHFKTRRPGGYRNEHEELISLDEEMKFHTKFLKDAQNYVNGNSSIILVENAAGVSAQDIIEIAKSDYDVTYIEYDSYGWTGESKFYTIVLRIK